MALEALKKLAPDMNWPIYVQEIGVNKVDSAIIGQPEFFTTLNNEIVNTA